jgi:hypothetical protein
LHCYGIKIRCFGNVYALPLLAIDYIASVLDAEAVSKNMIFLLNIIVDHPRKFVVLIIKTSDFT